MTTQTSDQLGSLYAWVLTDAAEQVAQYRLTVYGFERILRDSTRDVHQWGDERLKRMTLAAEGVISDYRFDGLPEAHIGQELVKALSRATERE